MLALFKLRCYEWITRDVMAVMGPKVFGLGATFKLLVLNGIFLVMAGIYGSAISMGLVTCYGKDDRLFYPAVNLAHSTRSARMGHLRRLSALLCTVKTSLRMVFMKLGQLCLMCWDMWQAVCTFHSCAVYSRIETLCVLHFWLFVRDSLLSLRCWCVW